MMSRKIQAFALRGAVALAGLAGVVLVLHAWQLPPFRSTVQTTDNAYVRGSITVIAPKVDGYVAEVLVADFAAVRPGQALVRLDDRIFRQRLDQARAQLDAQQAHLANVLQARRGREAGIAGAEASIAAAAAQQANARAQLHRALADARRVQELVVDGSLAERDRDQTEAALRGAEAALQQADAAFRQSRAGSASAHEELRTVVVNRRAIEATVAAAQAAVRLAEIDLENSIIRAPRAGSVGEVGVKLGQYVVPGTQLMALVPSSVWVVANFKEAQTADMAEGQPATFEVDALRGIRLTGHVERLSPATGSEFSVIRPDNATGNFTKVPQRLPVRIRVDHDQPLAARLRPGMSVVASVETAMENPR